MYCECLKNGGFCGPMCICVDCHNKFPNSERDKVILRYKAKKTILSSGSVNKGYGKLFFLVLLVIFIFGFISFGFISFDFVSFSFVNIFYGLFSLGINLVLVGTIWG
jgi:hypothetical protein